jgi:hypothetical protein
MLFGGITAFSLGVFDPGPVLIVNETRRMLLSGVHMGYHDPIMIIASSSVFSVR